MKMYEQNYCFMCGSRLGLKNCGDEGMVKYCEKCGKFRFPIYSSAVSMVVFNRERSKILLIQQYGKKDNILVAGYINKGETPQQALVRELREEVSLDAAEWNYNASSYFEKTDTLIHNFVVVSESEDFRTKKGEVDNAQWFTIRESMKSIKPDSLAEAFLLKALRDRGFAEN